MPKTSFREQLQSHIGGLVRVRLTSMGAWTQIIRNFNGKIGLLVRVDDLGAPSAAGRWRAEVLIDGSIETLVFYTGDLEFIGADDV
jgi:hypothetical protein